MYDWVDVVDAYLLFLQAIIVAWVVVYPIKVVLRMIQRLR
jgi:hypothetical protein